MRTISIIFLISIIINAQSIIKLESVSSQFETEYLQADHDWNPLLVGNLWQYSLNGNNGEVDTRYVEKDTVINGMTYYKKVDYLGIEDKKFFLWERNDWVTFSSYMIDLEDMNDNSIIDEELLLDSLEVEEDFYEYTSFRFAYRGWKDVVWFEPTKANVGRHEWYIVFGDTVLVREVEYPELARTEYVADQFGVIKITGDFYIQTLTGARIYGEEYGEIIASYINEDVPKQYFLEQNYPNPFNPETVIEYSVPKVSNIKLEVYNTLGELVQTLANGVQHPGIYRVVFKSENLSSGTYIYVLQTNGFVETKKMTLLK